MKPCYCTLCGKGQRLYRRRCAKCGVPMLAYKIAWKVRYGAVLLDTSNFPKRVIKLYP